MMDEWMDGWDEKVTNAVERERGESYVYRHH